MLGRNVRLGLVGYGHWGPNYAASAAAVPGASLTWCVDASAEARERARAAHPSLQLGSDLEAMLAAPDCDAVIVAVNPTQHAAVAERVLRAGKPLLVEKPLATDSASATRLAIEAERRKAITVAGHVYVFHPATRAISRRIRNGGIGRLRRLSASRAFTRMALPSARPDVDALWDLAPNDVAMFAHFAGGPPARVSAVRSARTHGDPADAYFVLLEWASGVVGELRVLWDYPRRERLVSVAGSKETIAFDDDAPQLLTAYDTSEPGVAVARPLACRREKALVAQLNHFTSCVRTGTRSPVDFRYGAGIVRILEAIDAAARDGVTVALTGS